MLIDLFEGACTKSTWGALPIPILAGKLPVIAVNYRTNMVQTILTLCRSHGFAG